MHEKALNIEFKNETIFSVICGTLSYKPVNTFDAEMCSLTSAASVSIVNKQVFEKRI